MTHSLELPEGWEQWPAPKKLALRDRLRYAKFQLTYEFDPVAFVHDCIDWTKVPEDGPTEYQEEILSRLVEEKSISVVGPHGLGKGTTIAFIEHWFALTRDDDDWKMPTTSGSWKQLAEFTWPEIHKWARLLRWDVIGRAPYLTGRELLDLAIQLDTGSAFSINSKDPAKMEGAHADRLCQVFDEAKTIPKDTVDATEGAAAGAGADTGKEAFRIMLSTPGESHGPFYETHQRRRPGWHPIHVSLERAIAANRISQEFVERMEQTWGPASAQFKRRVLGHFAASDSKSVIPLEWVELAVERWKALAVPTTESPDEPHVFMLNGKPHTLPIEVVGKLTCVSADISDQGEDSTVLTSRHGMALRAIRKLTFNPDPMESTGIIVSTLRGAGSGFPVVDAVGIGGPVVARLRELRSLGEVNYRAVPFIGSAGSDRYDDSGQFGFKNLRAEAWWGMKTRLHPTRGDDVALPPDDEMIADLTTPSWKEISDGKILIEPKDEMKKADRLGRSPDIGDSVVMNYWARPSRTKTTQVADRTIHG